MITCAQIDSKQAYLFKIRNVWLYFSYNTLVCIRYADSYNTVFIYETSTYHSSTTTRHINEFYKRYSKNTHSKSKVDNIEMLANQLLFESTKKMVVEQITE